MSSIGDSDFSAEMASGIAVASSVVVDDEALFYESISGPPVNTLWYKRRFVIFTVTAVLVLVVVTLAVVAVIGVQGVGIKAGVSGIPAGGTTTIEGDTGVTSTPPTLTPTTAASAPPSAPPIVRPTAPPAALERTNPSKYHGKRPRSTRILSIVNLT